jgi:hypothetical protein
MEVLPAGLFDLVAAGAIALVILASVSEAVAITKRGGSWLRVRR